MTHTESFRFQPPTWHEVLDILKSLRFGGCPGWTLEIFYNDAMKWWEVIFKSK